MKLMKFLLSLCVLTSLCGNLYAREQMPDFKKINPASKRKAAFFEYLLPKIERINLAIQQERELLIQLKMKHTLNIEDQTQLSKLADHYALPIPKDVNDWSRLLRRVDTVPPSMVLAQAANESAWGTSRFARVGSNLFGQWCYSKGCGIVPEKRNKGAHHEVKVFPTVQASIASYMHNLNTNRSYNYFRKIRAQNRQTQPVLKGKILAEGLTKYSERGKAYVDEIRALIKLNHLENYDKT